MQVWNEADAEEEVLALVVRTGINSSVGSMLRQVMSPFRNPFGGARNAFVLVGSHLKPCHFPCQRVP